MRTSWLSPSGQRAYTKFPNAAGWGSFDPSPQIITRDPRLPPPSKEERELMEPGDRILVRDPKSEFSILYEKICPTLEWFRASMARAVNAESQDSSFCQVRKTLSGHAAYPYCLVSATPKVGKIEGKAARIIYSMLTHKTVILGHKTSNYRTDNSPFRTHHSQGACRDLMGMKAQYVSEQIRKSIFGHPDSALLSWKYIGSIIKLLVERSSKHLASIHKIHPTSNTDRLRLAEILRVIAAESLVPTRSFSITPAFHFDSMKGAKRWATATVAMASGLLGAGAKRIELNDPTTGLKALFMMLEFNPMANWEFGSPHPWPLGDVPGPLSLTPDESISRGGFFRDSWDWGVATANAYLSDDCWMELSTVDPTGRYKASYKYSAPNLFHRRVNRNEGSETWRGRQAGISEIPVAYSCPWTCKIGNQIEPLGFAELEISKKMERDRYGSLAVAAEYSPATPGSRIESRIQDLAGAIKESDKNADKYGAFSFAKWLP